MKTLYDSIGDRYASSRRTEPRIARQIFRELVGARHLINIGAGTGSYEPPGLDMVAVEPSGRMIAQRPATACRAVRASAESLPFEDNSFSHAMTVLSVHHWTDRDRGFREISRVATDRFIMVTWDPHAPPFWLTRDYFPEIIGTDLLIFPELDELQDYFDDVRVRPLMIPEDCTDGFLAAFWKRPEAYLDPKVRASISTFAKSEDLAPGLESLASDLASGRWADINSEVLGLSELDAGYRLVTANIRPV